MTVEEVRERVNGIRDCAGPEYEARVVRVVREQTLFSDVLQSIADDTMSYGNAKALAAEALKVR